MTRRHVTTTGGNETRENKMAETPLSDSKPPQEYHHKHKKFRDYGRDDTKKGDKDEEDPLKVKCYSYGGLGHKKVDCQSKVNTVSDPIPPTHNLTLRKAPSTDEQ